MKKSILLAVAVISVAAVSCKKERTCECTTTTTTTTTFGGSSMSSSATTSQKTTAEKQTKKYFRMDQGCYSTTQKNSNTSGSSTTETVRETTCDVK